MDDTTRNFITRFVSKNVLPKGYTVLEIGSLDVNGEIRSLFHDACTYHGVDPIEGPTVDFVGCLCEDHVVRDLDKEYDVVLCLNVLEHDLNWRHTLSECFNRVKPHGHLLIVSPSEIDTNMLLFRTEYPRPIEASTHLLFSSNWYLHAGNNDDKIEYATGSPQYPDRVVAGMPSHPFPKIIMIGNRDDDPDSTSAATALERYYVKLSLPNDVSKHYTWKSRYVVSHNVHYTTPGGYYGNPTLGEMLEVMTFSGNINRFKLEHELHFDTGVQYCIDFERIQ